jgi:hypothetical protein
MSYTPTIMHQVPNNPRCRKASQWSGLVDSRELLHNEAGELIVANWIKRGRRRWALGDPVLIAPKREGDITIFNSVGLGYTASIFPRFYYLFISGLRMIARLLTGPTQRH